MTKRQSKSGTIDVKALLAGDEEFLRALVRTALQEVLEAEMTAALGAEKGERRRADRVIGRAITAGRRSPGSASSRCGCRRSAPGGSRPSCWSATRARSGRWWRRWRRSRCRGFDAEEPAPAKAGVKAITEELCGHGFSASSISAINQRLDASLAQFAGRLLAEAFPYLIRAARGSARPG